MMNLQSNGTYFRYLSSGVDFACGYPGPNLRPVQTLICINLCYVNPHICCIAL